MADEIITRQVSERYARALATGEQMCFPTSYHFEDLLESGPYIRHFAVINRAGEPVAGEALACGPGGSCC